MTIEGIYRKNTDLAKTPYKVFEDATYNKHENKVSDNDVYKKKVLASQKQVPEYLRHYLAKVNTDRP